MRIFTEFRKLDKFKHHVQVWIDFGKKIFENVK